MADEGRPIYISKELLRHAENLEAVNRVMSGQPASRADWLQLTPGQLLSLWLRQDQSIDVAVLDEQGVSEDEIERRRYPRRAEMIENLASHPLMRDATIQHWRNLEHLLQHEPWSPMLPAEFQRPWTDSISEERQLELWAHADPDVDVPTLMQQAKISYQDAVLGKYLYRQSLMTLGRPSLEAQHRYRDMMSNKLHDARLEAGKVPQHRRETVSINQTINNYGDGAVLSQAGRDSVMKHIQTGAGQSELRQLLDELKAALMEQAEDDDDAEDRQYAVERLGAALTKAEPVEGPIKRAWDRVVILATIEGAVQGGERLSHALQALAPYVAPWFAGAPPLPPGLMA